MRQSIQKSAFTLLTITISALLSACGGGGGSTVSNTPTPVATYKYQSAVQAQNTAGYSLSFNVAVSDSGQSICSGTGSISLMPSALQTTLNVAGNNVIVYSGSYATNINFPTASSCASLNSSLTKTSTYYFSTTSNLPVAINTNGQLSLVQTALNYPSAVSVGSTGTIGTYTIYSDSSATKKLGTETISYAVTAGASSDYVVVTTTDQVFDLTGATYITVTSVSHLSSTGVLSLQSVSDTLSGITVTLTVTN